MRNACRRLIFKHENAGTSSSTRNDVSRAAAARSELRRHIFCWRAHHGSFLPPNLHGEKTVTTECRFLCNAKRGIGQRLPSLPALSADGSRQASAQLD